MRGRRRDSAQRKAARGLPSSVHCSVSGAHAAPRLSCELFVLHKCRPVNRLVLFHIVWRYRFLLFMITLNSLRPRSRQLAEGHDGNGMKHRSGARYSAVAQALHWVTAVLVLVAFIYGPGGSEQRVYS